MAIDLVDEAAARLRTEIDRCRPSWIEITRRVCSSRSSREALKKETERRPRPPREDRAELARLQGRARRCASSGTREGHD